MKSFGINGILISLLFFIIGVIMALSLESYMLYVSTSWLIFGIMALSLDLVWGKGGILSLGQTVLYGLGGYGGAIMAINFKALVGNTFLIALPSGVLIGALVASIIGWVIFYARIAPLQITILTYTLTLIVWTFAVSFSTEIGQAVIGGDNGMSNIPEMILSFEPEASGLSEQGMFLSVLLLSLVSLVFTQFLMKTPFGKVIECIRLDIQKTELLGYDVRKYQTILFTIAGGIAGLGGSLFALWSNYLNPSIFSISEALLVPIYVLVGGLGSLTGAFLGAISVSGLSYYLGSFSSGYATLVIGVILILMVLFFDKGLIGAISYVFEKLDNKTKSSPLKISFPTDSYEYFCQGDSKRLKTKKVYKSFGGVIPVNGIDLEFMSGKVSCVIGPNGAGKSSYLSLCVGIYETEEGRIYLDDTDITKWPMYKRVHEGGLGVKMQKSQVYKNFSVEDNLWISAYSYTKNKYDADKVTKKMLEIIGGSEQKDRIVNTLSHGEQQWLDIIMLLSLSPKIILFDEPAAGMSRVEKGELSKLIINLCKHKTIVIVDHDMAFIKSLNPHITVLHEGGVFAKGSIEELHKDERILDIYLGRKNA